MLNSIKPQINPNSTWTKKSLTLPTKFFFFPDYSAKDLVAKNTHRHERFWPMWHKKLRPAFYKLLENNKFQHKEIQIHADENFLRTLYLPLDFLHIPHWSIYYKPIKTFIFYWDFIWKSNISSTYLKSARN